MSTETDDTSTNRDPRNDPQNTDILHRPDVSRAQSVRVCHGCNQIRVGDQTISWVRFELPLRRGGELKTVRIETWRSWSDKAVIINADQLQALADGSSDAG